jgi:hypothetical protein
MEQLATPGSSLLTAATLQLVEGMVRVNALGPVPVKGLAEPVEVFALLGASAVRSLQVAVARGLTRFVGRQTELATLGQALERTTARPHPTSPSSTCFGAIAMLRTMMTRAPFGPR